MEEILHQLIGGLFHYLKGVQPSKVVQDFLPSAVCLNIYTYRNDLMTSESVYLHTTKNALMYCLFEHVLIRVPLCVRKNDNMSRFFFIHYRTGFRSVTLGLGTKFHRRDASWP